MDSPQQNPRTAAWTDRAPERKTAAERTAENAAAERVAARPTCSPPMPDAAEAFEEPGYGHGV
jgi:hypothetical protein